MFETLMKDKKAKFKIFLIAGFFIISGFLIFSSPAFAATNSNTFYSQVKDKDQAYDFSTISWTAYEPTNTSVAISARAGNTGTPDGSWTDWNVVSNGGSLDAIDGYQYVQYKAVFTYTDTSLTPNLQDITINLVFYSNGVLTSSKYDTSSDANVMGGIKWDEDASLPSGTTVTVSLRTASSAVNLDTASWSNFTNATANCAKVSGTVTCTSSAIPSAMKDGLNDQWVQYKTTLTSTGANKPAVDNVILTYVVNARPEFDVPNTTASQISDSSNTNWGKVAIVYPIRDPDTTTGT
ncbi:hypothetical protein KKG51_04820, partial [Patescibacteria group bacterium]|nr:hypothetical protein [Patescibacteria group bacterium]